MAIAISDVGKVKIIQGTEGGDTYEVRMRGEMDKKKLCYRPVDEKDEFGISKRCSQVAGFGTDHVGTGACMYHGPDGKSHISKLKNGRHAHGMRRGLSTRIDKYKEKDQQELRSLEDELVSLKAIFEEFMETFPNPNDKSYGVNLERARRLVSSISSLVDRISKIESRNAITVSQVMYLRATVADILMKYIDDPFKQRQAAQELVQRVGGKNEYPIIEA